MAMSSNINLACEGESMPAMKPVELDQMFGEALNSGNIEGLLALYEPDASFIPVPGQEVHGTEAIRQAQEEFLAMNPNITLNTKVLAQTDDLALCTANWHLTGTGPDGPMDLNGQSVEVARKQSDGSWLFIIDNPFGLGWE